MNAALLLLPFFIPEPGMYKCVEGNGPSICEQKIRPIIKDNKLTEISVIYDGDCAGQGPYSYKCQDNYCGDNFGVITFTFEDETHYRWENNQYGFYCNFSKSK